MGKEFWFKHSVLFIMVSALAIIVIVVASGEGYCDVGLNINPNLPRITLHPTITVSPNPAYSHQTVTITGSGFNTTPYPGDTYPLAACPMAGSPVIIQPDGTFTLQVKFNGTGNIVIYGGDKWGHMSNSVNLTLLIPSPTPTALATATPAPQSGSPSPTQTPQATAIPDTVAPVTTISLTGVKDASGTYTSNVVCTLTAADNNGGSGANDTMYSLNGFDWNAYTAPFTISTPGNTTIFYRTTDRAGNQEIAKVELITIAGTAGQAAGTTATPTAGPTATPKADSGLLGSLLLPLLIVGFIGIYLIKKSR
jgi:hypothetical protein